MTGFLASALLAAATIPPALIGLFAFLIVLAIAVAFVKTPMFKGMVGEFIINLAMRLFLDKSKYHQLKNVTLPCEDGTTQIDHVVVSRFGIFVIETKNMRGWIFGSERDLKWTQKCRGRSFQFQNPLRQNYKHVAAMAESLSLPVEAFKSVIMFIGDATIKTQVPPNVMTKGLITFIKSHKTPVLTDEKVAQSLAVIAEQRLTPGIRTHIQHVQNVRDNVEKKRAARQVAVAESGPAAPAVAPASEAGKPVAIGATAPVEAAVATSGETPAAEPLCPKCGRNMVRRTARSGSGKPFLGCSGFPKCRTIVEITE